MGGDAICEIDGACLGGVEGRSMRNSLLIANHKHEGIIKNGRSGSRKSTQGYGGNDDIVSASASILTLESTWVGRRP